jgi:hypothetical protein
MSAAIERCIAMDASTTEQLGRAARGWYDTNRADWPARLRAAIAALP